MAKKKDDGTEEASGALGTDQSQAKMDAETEQGFRGTEADPTPNENYSVAGVTSGAPTPETDPNAANEARASTGLGLHPIEAGRREAELRAEAGKEKVKAREAVK